MVRNVMRTRYIILIITVCFFADHSHQIQEKSCVQQPPSFSYSLAPNNGGLLALIRTQVELVESVYDWYEMFLSHGVGIKKEVDTSRITIHTHEISRLPFGDCIPITIDSHSCVVFFPKDMSEKSPFDQELASLFLHGRRMVFVTVRHFHLMRHHYLQGKYNELSQAYTLKRDFQEQEYEKYSESIQKIYQLIVDIMTPYGFSISRNLNIETTLKNMRNQDWWFLWNDFIGKPSFSDALVSMPYAERALLCDSMLYIFDVLITCARVLSEKNEQGQTNPSRQKEDRYSALARCLTHIAEQGIVLRDTEEGVHIRFLKAYCLRKQGAYEAAIALLQPITGHLADLNLSSKMIITVLNEIGFNYHNLIHKLLDTYAAGRIVSSDTELCHIAAWLEAAQKAFDTALYYQQKHQEFNNSPLNRVRNITGRTWLHIDMLRSIVLEIPIQKKGNSLCAEVLCSCIKDIITLGSVLIERGNQEDTHTHRVFRMSFCSLVQTMQSIDFHSFSYKNLYQISRYQTEYEALISKNPVLAFHIQDVMQGFQRVIEMVKQEIELRACGIQVIQDTLKVLYEEYYKESSAYPSYETMVADMREELVRRLSHGKEIQWFDRLLAEIFSDEKMKDADLFMLTHLLKDPQYRVPINQICNDFDVEQQRFIGRMLEMRYWPLLGDQKIFRLRRDETVDQKKRSRSGDQGVLKKKDVDELQRKCEQIKERIKLMQQWYGFICLEENDDLEEKSSFFEAKIAFIKNAQGTATDTLTIGFKHDLEALIDDIQEELALVAHQRKQSIQCMIEHLAQLMDANQKECGIWQEAQQCIADIMTERDMRNFCGYIFSVIYREKQCKRRYEDLCKNIYAGAAPFSSKSSVENAIKDFIRETAPLEHSCQLHTVCIQWRTYMLPLIETLKTYLCAIRDTQQWFLMKQLHTDVQAMQVLYQTAYEVIPQILTFWGLSALHGENFFIEKIEEYEQKIADIQARKSFYERKQTVIISLDSLTQALNVDKIIFEKRSAAQAGQEPLYEFIRLCGEYLEEKLFVLCQNIPEIHTCAIIDSLRSRIASVQKAEQSIRHLADQFFYAQLADSTIAELWCVLKAMIRRIEQLVARKTDTINAYHPQADTFTHAGLYSQACQKSVVSQNRFLQALTSCKDQIDQQFQRIPLLVDQWRTGLFDQELFQSIQKECVISMLPLQEAYDQFIYTFTQKLIGRRGSARDLRRKGVLTEKEKDECRTPFYFNRYNYCVGLSPIVFKHLLDNVPQNQEACKSMVTGSQQWYQMWYYIISDQQDDRTDNTRGIAPAQFMEYFFNAITLLETQQNIMPLLAAAQIVSRQKEQISCSRAFQTLQPFLTEEKNCEETQRAVDALKNNMPIHRDVLFSQLIDWVLEVDDNSIAFLQFIKDSTGTMIPSKEMQMITHYLKSKKNREPENSLGESAYHEWLLVRKAS